jgi:hypothetical protein
MRAEAGRHRDPVVPGVLVFLTSKALVDRYPIEAERVVSAGHV